MVQHKPTPEEQLLKLIENPGGQAPGGARQGGVVTKPGAAKQKLPGFEKIQGFFLTLKAGFSKKTSSPVGRHFIWISSWPIAFCLPL